MLFGWLKLLTDQVISPFVSRVQIFFIKILSIPLLVFTRKHTPQSGAISCSIFAPLRKTISVVQNYRVLKFDKLLQDVTMCSRWEKIP